MIELACDEVRIPDFDTLYREASDPWEVETSWYERRKLAVLLATLPNPSYASIWEPGCGPGFTSPELARRTDALLATDASEVAIEQARARVGPAGNVTFEVSALPDAPSGPPVELVVVAEFLYYIEDLRDALETVWRQVAPGGQLAVMHWVHHPHDAYRSGRDMHTSIALDATARGATRIISHLDADFQIDIYTADP